MMVADPLGTKDQRAPNSMLKTRRGAYSLRAVVICPALEVKAVEQALQELPFLRHSLKRR